MEPHEPKRVARHAVFPKEADTMTAHDRPLLDDECPTTENEPRRGRDTEPPTNPTLSLEGGNAAVREVYRLFLDSEHAPALALAEELLAGGESDPLLHAIAGECRSTLERQEPLRLGPRTTLAEVAELAQTPLEEVIRLLERLVAVGSASLRPPR